MLTWNRQEFGTGTAVGRLRLVAGAAALLALAIGQSVPTVAARVRQEPRTVRLATVSEFPASAKRWALVIGVDDYTDEQITGLRGAANDAKSLSAALVEHAGFPRDQVIRLATGEPAPRLPTRTNILKYLSNLSAVVPKDGLLLVSFSGHGIERGGQAFLLPSDATAGNDVGLLEETAISVVRMHDRIRATGVGQVLVLLDACRNDPTTGRADSTNALSTAYTRGFDFDVANREVQAYATLYATSVGARAYEYVEKRQGYFTWAVVEGLSGAAADANGRVTLSGLIRHVELSVPKRVGVDYGAGKQQRPFARVEGYRADELVVAITATPSVAQVAAALAPAPVVVDPKAVEVALWNAIESSRDATDFENYLKQYPSGSYTSVARAKIKQLRAAAASAEPAVTRPSPASGGPTQPAATRSAVQGGARSFDLGYGGSIEMVLIEAGTFMMGSLNGESDEQPLHQVTISRPYYLGKYEVTQDQWAAVMGTSPSNFKGGNLPVEKVSWDDVQEFLRVLNKKTGGAWRLPTEAEWEYACRAGATGEYSGTLYDMGWYDSNSGSATHPVGQKRPNGWGLYDMHGNVYEWCQDWYGAYTRDEQTDPAGASRGSNRVNRGGSWTYGTANCRSASRGRLAPGYRFDALGFRLAKSL